MAPSFGLKTTSISARVANAWEFGLNGYLVKIGLICAQSAFPLPFNSAGPRPLRRASALVMGSMSNFCNVAWMGESILNDWAICPTVPSACLATCRVCAAAASLGGWSAMLSIDDWSCVSALMYLWLEEATYLSVFSGGVTNCTGWKA